MTKVSMKHLYVLLLFVFLFNTIFLPNDTFMMKKISLFVLLLLILLDTKEVIGYDEKCVFLLGLIVTLCIILQSIAITGDITENIKLGYPGVILLLYFPVKKYHINLKKLIYILLMELAWYISICGILDRLNIVSVNENRLLLWLFYSDNALIGKGSHVPFGVCIFLKASTMLLLALAMAFEERRFFDAIVILAALILSGTRANVFTAIAVFAVFVIMSSRNRSNRIAITTIISGLFLAVVIKFNIPAKLQRIAEVKQVSDDYRSHSLNSIFRYWSEQPIRLITGSGFSGKYFDSGRNDFISDVELSYWNLMRQLGFIMFVLVMIMILLPLFQLVKRRVGKHMILSYIGYLVIAYTNPLLYSSTGITVVLFMYYYTFILHKREVFTNPEHKRRDTSKALTAITTSNVLFEGQKK